MVKLEVVEPLRRTMLFLPAGNPRFLQRAIDSAADSLIRDLEDAVAPSEKETAREAAARALRETDFRGKERTVRVNSLSTPYGREDLMALAEAGPDALVVPKIHSPQDIEEVDALLTEQEKRLGRAPGGIRLMALIESPRGVLGAEAIALASPRLSGLLFGAGDYSLSTGGRPGAEELELLYPRTQVLLAARAAGIAAIDTPYPKFEDLEGLEKSARRARALGYEGKAVVHPNQIEVVNRVFTPSPQEVEYAQKVIAAFEGAVAAGKGAARFQGQLIERVQLTMAQRTLSLARRAGIG